MMKIGAARVVEARHFRPSEHNWRRVRPGRASPGERRSFCRGHRNEAGGSPERVIQRRGRSERVGARTFDADPPASSLARFAVRHRFGAGLPRGSRLFVRAPRRRSRRRVGPK
jgi:hypothetical protein